MGVLVEAITVIVPVAVIASKYDGGMDAFFAGAPNKWYCSDGYLTAIRFMTAVDAHEHIRGLEKRGITFRSGDSFAEIAVVDQMQGPILQSDWLLAGRFESGIAVAWLKGTAASPLAHPIGWDPSYSAQLQFVSAAEAQDRLLPLARRGTVDVMLDYLTGREVYIGRTGKKPL